MVVWTPYRLYSGPFVVLCRLNFLRPNSKQVHALLLRGSRGPGVRRPSRRMDSPLSSDAPLKAQDSGTFLRSCRECPLSVKKYGNSTIEV